MQFVILTTGDGGERQILFLVSEEVDHPHNLAFHFLTSISDGVRDLGEFLSSYECHYLLDVTMCICVYFNTPREKRRRNARRVAQTNVCEVCIIRGPLTCTRRHYHVSSLRLVS